MKESELETAGIGTLLRRYSLPCVVSLLLGSLYNIVDQLFIANAPYLGSYGNAANTVVFPLTVIALAAAVMIGDGCCSLVSISLGSGSREKAARAVGNAIVLSSAAGLGLLAGYLVFGDRLLALFGGLVNDRTYALAREYFFWIALGIPFYIFGQAMNPIIRADGSPRFAMASMVAGALANLILDPLFIYGFRWGMAGAAIATVIGQLITAAAAALYLKKTRQLALGRSAFRIDVPLIREFLSLGLTSLLAQVSLVASMAAMQNMVLKYGALDPVYGQARYSQIPMAVLGIVMKFFQIVISVVIGIASGCLPVVGHNVGAGRYDRVRKLLRAVLARETLLGTASLAIIELFPRQLISLFGAASESAYYTGFGVRSFRIYLSMMILACLNKAVFIFLQSMGKALSSTLLSLVREIVFGVGLALALPRLFGLDGALYSMPAADILTFIITVVVLLGLRKELRQRESRCPTAVLAVNPS